ncbi:hypothetical protein [Streptomyces sp. NPDC003717]|uniref:hypothetical protein n=1 Tax=Streptomyces sp. NPDC003717 TaxID=3154276 RepID=UPI0033A3E81B
MTRTRAVPRAVRRTAALGFGALWWWAVLRLALVPDAGVVEGAVAVGGWGLSVLPVHCAPKRRSAGVLGAGRWRWAFAARRGPAAGRGGVAEGGRGVVAADGGAGAGHVLRPEDGAEAVVRPEDRPFE